MELQTLSMRSNHLKPPKSSVRVSMFKMSRAVGMAVYKFTLGQSVRVEDGCDMYMLNFMKGTSIQRTFPYNERFCTPDTVRYGQVLQ